MKRSKIQSDDTLFRGYLYHPELVLKIANVEFGEEEPDVRKAVVRAFKYMEDSNNETLAHNMLVSGQVDYLCMSHQLPIINWKIQNHIPPLVFVPDEYPKEFRLIEKMKCDYLKSVRTITNETDNEYVIEHLGNILKRRMLNLRTRCKESKYPNPKSEVFREVLQESLNGKFECEYCHQKLRLKGKAQATSHLNFEDLFSFEHRTPLSKGGTHQKENIIITCLSCNKVKGSMDEKDFLEMLSKISKELKYKLYHEASARDNRVGSAVDVYRDQVKQLNKLNLELKKQNNIYKRKNRELINAR